jgi:hypothetical protein
MKLAEKRAEHSVPTWLLEICESRLLPEAIPLRSILENSCFYPASGLDVKPIEIASGISHSFIYCDYNISSEELLDFISNRISKYKLICSRFICKEELVPRNWTPEIPRDFDLSHGADTLRLAQGNCELFAHWSILKEEVDPDSGIKDGNCISVLFISGEALACYQGLYLRNKAVPRILSIIQPGHTLGGNWTNFFNPEAPFWRIIERGELPDMLILGEWIRKTDPYVFRLMGAPYVCPFGDRYINLEIITSSENKWIDSVVGIFEIDKRTDQQRERDNTEERIKLELERERRERDELNRKIMQKVWFEEYKKIRLEFKKAPKEVIRMSREEVLEKQDFDKQVNKLRASYNMFGALKRSDFLAISALIANGADINFKRDDGLTVFEYAKELGVERQLRK